MASKYFGSLVSWDSRVNSKDRDAMSANIHHPLASWGSPLDALNWRTSISLI